MKIVEYKVTIEIDETIVPITFMAEEMSEDVLKAYTRMYVRWFFNNQKIDDGYIIKDVSKQFTIGFIE